MRLLFRLDTWLVGAVLTRFLVSSAAAAAAEAVVWKFMISLKAYHCKLLFFKLVGLVFDLRESGGFCAAY